MIRPGEGGRQVGADRRDEVYRDICHLTPEGSAAFVELLLPDALRALESTRP